MFFSLSAENPCLIGHIARFIVMRLGKRSDNGPFWVCCGSTHAIHSRLCSRHNLRRRPCFPSVMERPSLCLASLHVGSKKWNPSANLESRVHKHLISRPKAMPNKGFARTLYQPDSFRSRAGSSGHEWLRSKTAVAPYDDRLKKLKRSEDGLQYEQSLTRRTQTSLTDNGVFSSSHPPGLTLSDNTPQYPDIEPRARAPGHELRT